jgi:hypothetical protein
MDVLPTLRPDLNVASAARDVQLMVDDFIFRALALIEVGGATR